MASPEATFVHPATILPQEHALSNTQGKSKQVGGSMQEKLRANTIYGESSL